MSNTVILIHLFIWENQSERATEVVTELYCVARWGESSFYKVDVQIRDSAKYVQAFIIDFVSATLKYENYISREVLLTHLVML